MRVQPVPLSEQLKVHVLVPCPNCHRTYGSLGVPDPVVFRIWCAAHSEPYTCVLEGSGVLAALEEDDVL